jgi:signal transduction histidine kinase
MRNRIAPAALLVAFAFVVVGFLRADREMTGAETDRGELTASETATLVEVFLLRHIVQLRTAAQLYDASNAGAVDAPSRTTGGSTADTAQYAGLRPVFEAVWVTDTLGGRRTTLFANGVATNDSTAKSLGDLVRRSLGSRLESHKAPNAFVHPSRRSSHLVFVAPIRTPRNAVELIVGVQPIDSLTAWLRQNPRTTRFSIMVRAGDDTIVSLARNEPSRTIKTVERTIVTPFPDPWRLTMTYSPSGRGVRIALWVVGLGAIVGLGVGLLLERREASRIADRSSELEHLSAELLRANRAKSEFLANVSHELRTPLNAIVGFVDLLRDGVYGALNSRQVGPVERIEASANHLRHLVDQILDLAKMAAGRLEVHAEPIELRPFVFDVASEVEPLLTEKGLSFSLAVGATLPRVRTDPTHLRQILINLLGNAVKFTSSGSVSVRGKLFTGGDDRSSSLLPVRFTTAVESVKPPRPGGAWIALQVVDSGVGIPPKDRERIFDEFEQVNAGPRGDSMRRGTGLGLSISRRLARLLGGDISVESELGRGSIFTIWLPVDPADLRGDQAA